MNISLPFSILYEDHHYIAINKPAGIMVHRTSITEDKEFILQLLRDQIQLKLNPIHRLDRGTTGVLIFAKGGEAASLLGKQFQKQVVGKQYLAIIRGFIEEPTWTVDYPLAKETWLDKKEAITHFEQLAQVELPVAIGRYETARYTLVKAMPETGRRHQIRRHLSHLRHPIIGDKRHGDVKHNRYWKEQFGIGQMLLHAQSLQLTHPYEEKRITIEAPLDSKFQEALNLLKITIKNLGG